MKAAGGARTRAALFAGILLACGAVYLTSIRNPEPKTVAAARGGFSAVRAMRDLEAITKAPRPWTGNQAAREYIVETLAKDGLEPEVQTVSSVITQGKPVKNIALRIKGRRGGAAVVLTAHYDTMALSRGAGDDGTGTVILMELARAIRAGPALDNDIVVALTDAEEFGLIGAIAFAGGHPWMRDARLAINLEGITAGPPVMWRSGSRQGWSIGLLALSGSGTALAPYLFGGSPMGDTDFTAFSLKGLPGYDFLTVYSYPNNHSMEDLPSGIDPGSVQRAGEVLLRLTKSLGGTDLSSPPRPREDMVYFNLLGAMAYYPRKAVLPASVLLAVLLAAALGLAARRGALSWRGTAAGLAGSLATLAAAPLLVTILWRSLEAGSLGSALSLLPSTFIGLFKPHDWPHSPNDAWLLAACLALAALATIGGLSLAGRRAKARELLAGALILWSALALLAAIAFPAANYLLLWPALLDLAAFLAMIATRGMARPHPAIAGLAAFAALALTLPAFYLLYLATGLGTLPVSALLASLVVMAVYPHFRPSDGPSAEAGRGGRKRAGAVQEETAPA